MTNPNFAFIVARPGFEPRQSEPKSDVLPLYYRAIPPLKRQPKKSHPFQMECKYRVINYILQTKFIISGIKVLLNTVKHLHASFNLNSIH